MLNEGLMSSNRKDWATPWDLYNRLDKEFNFTLDVCATKENTKCSRFFSIEDNCLNQSWAGEVCFMNPPYGQEITFFVEKAKEEAEKGAIVVGLLPARTDTRWFHEFVYGIAEIRFIRGRVKFVGASASAPFPSMIAVWRKMWYEC